MDATLPSHSSLVTRFPSPQAKVHVTSPALATEVLEVNA